MAGPLRLLKQKEVFQISLLGTPHQLLHRQMMGRYAARYASRPAEYLVAKIKVISFVCSQFEIDGTVLHQTRRIPMERNEVSAGGSDEVQVGQLVQSTLLHVVEFDHRRPYEYAMGPGDVHGGLAGREAARFGPALGIADVLRRDGDAPSEPGSENESDRRSTYFECLRRSSELPKWSLASYGERKREFSNDELVHQGSRIFGPSRDYDATTGCGCFGLRGKIPRDARLVGVNGPFGSTKQNTGSDSVMVGPTFCRAHPR